MARNKIVKWKCNKRNPAVGYSDERSNSPTNKKWKYIVGKNRDLQRRAGGPREKGRRETSLKTSSGAEEEEKITVSITRAEERGKGLNA